ncbi:unnamed protein product [Bursaphelenchus okinawaensis]|uniref:glucuronosyltransferase n=1 Tax=Bursaphelenchus okinawaensis TaxID=465554 RepID=A0A811K2C8_9BILA|nr:unnamed protein product [Bursaphelenchus okinawaensis]CAG9090467.1 unnamed protein product [Bursaphelenchus okinawaensis]
MFNPKIGGSHVLLMGKIADELAEKGHEVVVVQLILNENITFSGHSNSNVKLIEVPVTPTMVQFYNNMNSVWTKVYSSDHLSKVGKVFRDSCKDLYNNDDVIHDLKNQKFDLAIAEWINVCGLGLFKYIGILKWITVFGTAINPQFLSTFGLPASSFIPGLFEGDTGRLLSSRLKRAANFLYDEHVVYKGLAGTTSEAYRIFDEKLGYKLKTTMNYNFLILLFFCFVGHGFGFNILVNNPQFGGSHSLFMNKLALILADQGHNIVMIQSLLDENPDAPISHKNIEIVKAEVSVSMMSAIKHNIGDVWTKKKDSTDFARTGRVFHAACVDLYNNKTLMTTLKSKNFDLGLTEWIDSCGYGFFKHLGIERYISASGPTLPAELMGTLGVPSAISFVPGILSGQAERSFWGRAKDIFGYLMVDWVVIPSLQDKPAEAYQVFGGSWSFRVSYNCSRKG